MKKITLAAAIVCAAAVGHAATITWGGSTELVGGAYDDYAMPGATYALYALGTEAVTASDITTYYKDSYEILVGGNKVSALDVKPISQSQADSGAFSFDKPVTSASGYSNQYFALLCYDPETVDDKFYVAIYQAGALSDTQPNSIFTDLNSSEFTATAGFLTGATAGGTVAAVPEPTSGLLLLLGVAGLALRRRRA